jgi:RNA polymerase sigma-70 factor (ECF subfamily)
MSGSSLPRNAQLSDEAPRGATPAAPLGEVRLVNAARNGDEAACEELFRQHRDDLFRVAWRFCRDHDTALDLVQNTFVRAFRSLDNYRGDDRSLATWLRRILTNLAIDRTRRNRLETVPFDGAQHDRGDGRLGTQERAPVPRPDDLAAQRESLAALHGALGQLSEKHREVFLLHALEGLTYREIGERLGCSIGTIMSRLHYARKNLQALLGWHPDDDDA